MLARHVAVVAALSLLVACSGSTEPENTGEEVDDTGAAQLARDEEACSFRSMAGRTLTAGENPDTTAPEIILRTEPNTITIVPDRANYVRMEISRPGTLSVYAGEVDLFVQVVDGREPLTADEPEVVTACDDIPERHDIVIEEAGTYHARVAWAGFSELWLYARMD